MTKINQKQIKPQNVAPHSANTLEPKRSQKERKIGK